MIVLGGVAVWGNVNGLVSCVEDQGSTSPKGSPSKNKHPTRTAVGRHALLVSIFSHCCSRRSNKRRSTTPRRRCLFLSWAALDVFACTRYPTAGASKTRVYHTVEHPSAYYLQQKNSSMQKQHDTKGGKLDAGFQKTTIYMLAVLHRTFTSCWRSSLSTASERGGSVYLCSDGDGGRRGCRLCTSQDFGGICFLSLSGGHLQYFTVRLLLKYTTGPLI